MRSIKSQMSKNIMKSLFACLPCSEQNIADQTRPIYIQDLSERWQDIAMGWLSFLAATRIPQGVALVFGPKARYSGSQ